ncbi:aminotransferase [Pseudomonas typographi]|uniref:aminotransferase n=1 Tax=Pseudomonas typographi TaxID=2715964 RepID=UPI001682D777|nr:aminotransferase [Pseudomonas typographi]MBD1555101.1 aminotransferase [Pseudomonas typographi]
MPLQTLAHRAGLAAPNIDAPYVLALLREHYGLTGALHELGSQQDQNWRLDAPEGRFVVKCCRGEYAAAELQAQHAALAHLANLGLPVANVLQSVTGEGLLKVEQRGERFWLRVLRYLEGEPLAGRPHVGPALVARLGALAGQVSQALATFDHPGLDRELQWDPRHLPAVAEHLLPALAGQPRQAQVAACVEQAWAALAPLAGQLPQQAVHLDLTDDNTVWQRDAQRHWQASGIIDFGDLVRTWRVAELAVSCSALLQHGQGDAFVMLPAVRAFHAAAPLSPAEARALWPMVAGRAAVLVLSSARQLQLDPGNRYIQENVAHEWAIFEAVQAVPMALMEAAVLQACGLPTEPLALGPCLPLFPDIAPATVRCVDLGVLSRHFEAGNWEVPGAETLILAEQAGNGVACTRYGEYRLAHTLIDSPQQPPTHALHVELLLPPGTQVQAPFAGTWVADPQGGLQLVAAHACLRVWGVASDLPAGHAVSAGQRLGSAAGPVRVQLAKAGVESPPLFTTAARAQAWQALCPSPAALLGWACDAPADDRAQQWLARREASFARSQKHYYETPPRIERGWRNHLIDMQGRSYLDMLNNVAVLGHGHPRMAQVAARQWSLLNTNSRFHYAAVAQFSERLLERAPAGMDRVFLVNSGTEANDLAIRLARAFSGGTDMLCVLEAYHGWSVATDAISTSIADNPQALQTRPAWVHPVMAPNTYRGAHRGPGSAAAYLADVDAKLARLGEQARQLAGFICEPVYGNAGGIALPTGYLQGVYARVRERGGVCIADEVQVGYGRLGEYFWGFEEQGVVPDIITMAKGMGNGHPLGAVITRRDIAQALEAQGYFFSSAGGSPVSCQVGMAVLDVMEHEKLWENARETGAYFKARLQALVARFALAGAAHGSGFYLGLELVRDRATLEPATEETALLCERLRELGIFMQPTGDHLNILKIKPPMNTTRQSVDFFVDCVAKVLAEGL